MAHILAPKMNGGLILYFLTPYCNFKTLIARGKVGMEFWGNETCQCVSTDIGHDKIIGALWIVEKMPLVMHTNGPKTWRGSKQGSVASVTNSSR